MTPNQPCSRLPTAPARGETGVVQGLPLLLLRSEGAALPRHGRRPCRSAPHLLARPDLFAHIGMDRLLGYGLKYPTGFRHTHLGRIGREKREGTGASAG